MQGNLWKGKKLGYNPRLNSLLRCSSEGLLVIQVKNSGSHYSSIPPHLCTGKKANQLAQESESPAIYSTECRKKYEKVECKSFWLILCKNQKASRPHPSAMHIAQAPSDTLLLLLHLNKFIQTFKHDQAWQHVKLKLWRLPKIEDSMERWKCLSPFGPSISS